MKGQGTAKMKNACIDKKRKRERSHTTSRAKGGGGGQRKCDYPCKGDRKMRDVRREGVQNP